MARASIDKPYATFTGGLVTEATGLSFPENSAREANNVDFNKSGLVQRRLGLTSEIGENFVDITLASYDGTQAITTYLWRSPQAGTRKQFLVVQIGNVLRFYKADADAVLDESAIPGLINQSVVIGTTGATDNEINFQSFVISDRLTGARFTAAQTELFPCQYAEVNGYLVITSPTIVPIVVEYDEDLLALRCEAVADRQRTTAGTFFTGRYRDFQGVDDGTEVDFQPATLTPIHLYNLLNAGWKEADIEAYFVANSVYPSRAQDWKAGKDASNNFSVTELDKVDFGNTPAPIGRKLINFDGSGTRTTTFDGVALASATFGDGSATSPLVIDPSQEHERLQSALTCVGYSGRLFIAGDVCANQPNGVYFSKVVQKQTDLGVFRQEADPTSEGVSDLIDSDGGVFFIPEGGRIRRLTAMGDGVLAFCDNGVWYIRGPDEGFRATSFAVDKISSESVISPYSVVEVEDSVFFWSLSGIYVVTPQGVQKLSDKIESFYAELTEEQLATSWGSFDLFNRKVVWSFADRLLVDQKGKLNEYLIYDIVTQSFTRYTVTEAPISAGSTTSSIPGPHFVPTTQPNVSYQDPSNLLSLDIIRASDSVAPLAIKVLTVSDNGASRVTKQLFEFTNRNFADWVGYYDTIGEEFTTSGSNYISRLVTGEEVMGAPQVDKQARYVHSFFSRTENAGITIDAGEVEYVIPSGCQMTVLYDFQQGSASNRKTRPQQAYRPRRGLPISIGAGVGSQAAIDNGERVVYSKLKARGSGRAISIQYESENGKDFQLLGFAIQGSGNTL